MLAKEIEDKAFALNAGQHTKPIRTKQGFIILQVTDHNQGGDAGFKKAEPQVEEALFLEQMQPKLREYLTKLREEAYVEIKPGVVDTGASGNEMRLSYSAYTPPAEKKKKKFARTRFRGRDRIAEPPVGKYGNTSHSCSHHPFRSAWSNYLRGGNGSSSRCDCCSRRSSRRPNKKPRAPRPRPTTPAWVSRSPASARKSVSGRPPANRFLPRKSPPRLLLTRQPTTSRA